MNDLKRTVIDQVETNRLRQEGFTEVEIEALKAAALDTGRHAEYKQLLTHKLVPRTATENQLFKAHQAVKGSQLQLTLEQIRIIYQAMIGAV